MQEMRDAMTGTSVSRLARHADVHDVYVLPGEVRTAAEPTRFLTVLGSCVAICLYDLDKRVGGINHFLLPGAVPDGERERCRWSEASIDELFEQVQSAGARARRLQAKVFGGAQITTRQIPGSFRIGDRNVEMALAALQRRRVELVNSSVGGNAGRKIIFEVHTGIVWMKDLVHHRA